MPSAKTAHDTLLLLLCAALLRFASGVSCSSASVLCLEVSVKHRARTAMGTGPGDTLMNVGSSSMPFSQSRTHSSNACSAVQSARKPVPSEGL
jgi:hypothetical protein